jgi:hypothetical protein
MSNGLQMPHAIKWLALKWTRVIKKNHLGLLYE